MVSWLLQKVLGTYHERECRRLWPIVEQINRIEPQMQALSEASWPAKTQELRERVRQALADQRFLTPQDAAWYDLNHDERATLKRQRRQAQQRALDLILPEAFALVREASHRVLKMRHFDVQLLGGMVLHEGKIAEMTTGEGKTLVATLPAYLNALTGRGVHLVTVNDYLARRDARWMGPIYHALGLSVGVIQGVDPATGTRAESLSFLYDPAWTQTAERFLHLRPIGRREAYGADIVYGQNNEFGFDYLRDNMRFRLEEMVQREFHYAIVDEVDSILIDEARTPLIISGPAEESTELYHRLDRLVRQLHKESDYEVDEKDHAVSLTEPGIKRCEELLHVDNLYHEAQMRLLHHIHQALRAHELYHLDVEYMVKDGEIIIVDEFTGRLMPGRRWSDGLHQAIEAKEGVDIRQENQTLASVTFQNYFRMYEKLSGMTGTASTEAQEFNTIYRLDVVAVPTNRPLIRVSHPDVVYRTEEEKFVAVVQEIVSLFRRGQPVLIGTISIEKSERLSRMLKEPAGLLARLARVCQWAQEELKKESLPAELAEAMARALARPAMIAPAQATALLEQVRAAAPKSVLVYRWEDVERLAQTIETVTQGLPHHVLNAKYHEQEAAIVAQAGRKGAVTIATNMAGRGTDILLGGHPQALAEQMIREAEGGGETPLPEEERTAILRRFERLCEEERAQVVALGGLHILATERHEARRIDNQLRGRSGRQGDPGSSRFYLSLADDLMRIFGSDRIARLMDFKWFQWEEGLPIEHRMVTKAIETAQKRVEGHNFDVRKQLLEYDNTMNRQREVIYEQRRRILEGVDLDGMVRDIIAEVVDALLDTFVSKELRPDAWDLAGLTQALKRQWSIDVEEGALSGEREAIGERVAEAFQRAYEAKQASLGAEAMRRHAATVLLVIMDAKWKDHLYMMDALREGIHLRAYGQRDPLVEYQREAYRMFQELTQAVKEDSLALLLRLQPAAPEEAAAVRSVFATTPQHALHPDAPSLSMEVEGRGSKVEAGLPSTFHLPPSTASASSSLEPRAPAQRPTTMVHRAGPKVGRNDPCPCGKMDEHGKPVKYKKCHGQ